MPLYRPSELEAYLKSIGVHPKKRLSQNFLVDGNIVKKILRLADLQEDDLVLEIGPGPGALTEQLLSSEATIIAVEKDPLLAKALEKNITPDQVYCEDIMKFPIEKELSRYLHKDKRGKVIANLPYHLTTPIMTKLAPMHHIISTLVVMVQEEVAQRFVAEPKTKEYSSLTVYLNLYSTPTYGFHVSKNCFYPKPNVDSAVIRLDLHPPPEGVNVDDFLTLTRTGFGQRRKTLRSSLKNLYPRDAIDKALNSMGKPIATRPEELSLKEFLSLYALLSKLVNQSSKE